MGDSTVLKPGQWWRKPFGMLQTNLREIDVDMNVDQVADYIIDHGADAWLISVAGIQAQYPTELSWHTYNPLVAKRSSGDLIGDALQAAHSRGLRLLARMDFSKVPARVAAENPDWTFISPEGNLQEHPGDLVSVCLSGPYYQERLFDILGEVIQRYKLDGFFLNWMVMSEEDYFKRYHGVCHCSSCQRDWIAYTGGLEMPKCPQDTYYPEWLQFSRKIIDDLTARIRTFIAERLPDACLIMAERGHVMFHEANNAVGRELWHHATSERTSALRSFQPEVNVLVNSTTFMDMPYRLASEEPAHFAQYFLQAMSRGGCPSTYMMGIPGKIPYLCMDTAKEIHQFHKKWDTIYNGMQPCAKTALVCPDRGLMSEQHFSEALSEYRGLFTAMQELHVLFDIVGQEHLKTMSTNGSLARYQILILPELGQLKQDHVNVLDEWVFAGGHLVTTASTGVASNGTMQLKSLPVDRQRAIVKKRELLFSTYFAPPQTNSDPSYYNGPIAAIYGSYHLFQWKTDSASRYRSLSRAGFAPPEKAHGNVEIDHRGCGVGSYGSGKGIVIPFTIGRCYREIGLRVYRDLFEEILREEGQATEPVSVSIAEQVDVTVNANASKLIIHLINMSGARKQNFGSHLPISGGKVYVPEGAKVHLLLRDEELKVTGGEAKLAELDLYEVVVVDIA